MAETLPPSPDPSAPSSASTVVWRRTLLVAVVLCGLALLGLLGQHFRAQAYDPLKSPQLEALKRQLLLEPKNEQLKTDIRQLDLVLRQQHFRHQAWTQFGTWFLVVGTVVLVLAAKSLAHLHARLPTPQTRADDTERALATAHQARRWAVGVGIVTGGAFLLLAVPSKTRLPATPGELERLLAQLRGEVIEAVDLPTAAEFAANWPRFLGPTGNAFASNATPPLKFDLASGEGVLWRTPLSVPGFNSPIIWSNRVYLSGGDATNRSVFCFDLATGDPVWQRTVANVPGSPTKPLDIPESTGFAASTMATDGQRVYVMFANGDLAAFTLDGGPLWVRNLGTPHNHYGHAISLATWQNRVIVQFDHGEADENISKLLALDGASGRVAWEKPRAFGSSWASPAVAEAAGKPQILTLAGEWAVAYLATDGSELWRAGVLHGEIAPSPIFIASYALIPSPADTLYAVRPDGSGDVTKTHVAWKTDEGIPDITTPVSNGELAFTVLTHGIVTCHDLRDGAPLWEHECDVDINATPAIAGDRLYLLGTKGTVIVMAVAREARELARFDLGEGMFASPAFAHGVMVIRTVKSLIGVGNPPAATLEASRS
ncbi:MAG: PQQ-binding-like beta-propeller repeat protein [Verrucomicrobiales bacterium]|nr:PQQ-binding-like beta-propeller repeat protein [Verrucomicrobiales bacterium]